MMGSAGKPFVAMIETLKLDADPSVRLQAFAALSRMKVDTN
jgi:hypothetical protein